MDNLPPVSGVLLAAGLSSRMGRFKPRLLHEGEPFVVGIARKMSQVCRRTAVVIGHESALVRAAFDDWPKQLPLEFVENPEYAEGMFTSLQAGARRLDGAAWVLYHFVDQPHLPLEFYEQFAAEIDPAFDWIQPSYEGRVGHPLILGSAMLRIICEAPPQSTLRELSAMAGPRIKLWPCEYPQILDDIDTIGDLTRIQHKPQAHE